MSDAAREIMVLTKTDGEPGNSDAVWAGTITDESGGSGVQANSAAYRVMDEYGQVQPSGSVALMDGTYSFTVALEASRRGNDQDGRHYTIAVSAKDIAGNPGSASATVTVPRN